ncbi:MAG: hypothetical protein AAF683_01780 [Pseudomonadota bacterium]
MGWIPTLIGLAISLGLCVLANWRAGRPRDDLRPWAISWRLVLIFSGFVCFLFLVNAVNLLGIETGADQSPFRRF